jgi:hypothetical protein
MVPEDQIKFVSSDGHDILGVLEMDDRERIAFCRADGAIISLTDETVLDCIFARVMRLRAEQDAEHGGPEHDDTHTPAEWLSFIRKFAARAETHTGEAVDVGDEAWEMALFHIQALCVAAIQSSMRKRKRS